MAKAYLIGGTLRVGKTTLTMRFIASRPIMAISTDAVRYMLRRVIDEQVEPDLFHLRKFTSDNPERRYQLANNPAEAIELQNRESAIVWTAVANFVRSNLEDGIGKLVEGTAVTPKAVSQADFPCQAIFLGNQSEQHYKTILDSARSNPSDWLHNLEDETIQAFATFNQAFSQHIEMDAEKYGLPYMEVSDDNFSEDLTIALNRLQK